MITNTQYSVVTEGVAIGFAVLGSLNPVVGDQANALPPVADNCVELPLHIATSLPAFAFGLDSTVMVEQLTVLHPFGSSAVTQYVLDTVGVATGFGQSVQLNVSVGPSHL